ncbi:hypothetical protein CRM22_006041 [Opisthorchis felineus]|uniref:PH domain-containing protein n=2 Tax=Opisthorchis felineus TaxID=147828 RepID=A0A4S2LMZ2_OPIFE|nr:hypothetical protein CRM22_006041 [Opisthorchis felineus]
MKNSMSRSSMKPSIHEEATRQFGFESVSGEIDRALLSSSTRSSMILQELHTVNESMEIAIHDGHGCSTTVRIDPFTSAGDACRMIDPDIDLRFVQLYEEIPDLPGFAHAIEDHEPLMNVVRRWYCTGAANKLTIGLPARLCLLDNPSKYTPLTEDQVTSDRSLSYTSLGSIGEHDMMGLVTTSRGQFRNAPKVRRDVASYVTSGILWFRTPKKPWQKMFCFLHGSSVFYSLKKRAVTSRYMRILVDLSTVDVFHPTTLNQRNLFKAPTSELIVCRPISNHQIDLKDVTVFACRTPEGRTAWENGFRIHKFGLSRLEMNFCKARSEHEFTPLVKTSTLNHQTKEDDHTPMNSGDEDEILTHF